MTINKEQPVSDAILPCDVTLPPATTICAGCKLSTLVHALELRGMESHPLEQQQAVNGDVDRIIVDFKAGDMDAGGTIAALEKLARAALTASGMEAWQPIETAPKDGSLVLVWNGQRVNAAEYLREGEWTFAYGCSECRDGIYPQPTHWMPLPEPPRTALHRNQELGS